MCVCVCVCVCVCMCVCICVLVGFKSHIIGTIMRGRAVMIHKIMDFESVSLHKEGVNDGVSKL